MASAGEENRDNDRKAEQHRVEKPRHDGHRADAGKARSHEELGSVRQDALDTARGSVQEAGAAARVDVKLLGNMFGNVSYGEDGNRVVRRADIRKSHEPADAPFGAGAGFDAAGDEVYHIVEASVVTDKRKDTAGKHGDKDEFGHPHDAVQGAGLPSDQVITAVPHAGCARENIAQREYDQYIDTRCRADEDSEVGGYFQ